MTGDEGDEEKYSLTKKEKLLLEEYKLGQDAYYRSESEYSSRENFFIVAEGIIVAAAVQAVKERLYLIAILISLFGIILSLIWFFMEARSYTYSAARVKRLKEIETMLPLDTKSNANVFAFETRCGAIRKEKNSRHWYEEMKDWCLRKSIPLIFCILWIVIFLYSSFDLCKIQCSQWGLTGLLFKILCLYFSCGFIVLLIVIAIIIASLCIFCRCKDSD